MDPGPDPDISFRESKLFQNLRDKGEAWRKQYRRKDISVGFNENGKQKIRESFQGFDFKSPNGMLQYSGLPKRHYSSRNDPVTGLANLYELENFGMRLGANIFVKDEAQNPSGCFKDRESLMCLLNSRSHGHQGAVVFSSGNAAVSASIYSQDLPSGLIAFVPGDTYPEKIGFIRDYGSDVVVVGDEKTSFEKGYRLYCQAGQERYFRKSGHGNWSVRNPYRVLGDKTTAVEIAKEFQHANGKVEVPDYVVVPTANGSCLAGIWKGFKELRELGLIDSLPKMVSAGIKNASPVFGAVQEEQTEIPFRCDPSKVSDENARIGSIIMAEEGYDSIQASKAVLESGGTAVETTWKEIERMFRLFLIEEKKLAVENNILPEPASMTVLSAMEKIGLEKTDKAVGILTGIGIKSKRKIFELIDKNSPEGKTASRILREQQKNSFPKAEKRGRRIDCKADLESLKKAFDKLKHS